MKQIREIRKRLQKDLLYWESLFLKNSKNDMKLTLLC